MGCEMAECECGGHIAEVVSNPHDPEVIGRRCLRCWEEFGLEKEEECKGSTREEIRQDVGPTDKEQRSL